MMLVLACVFSIAGILLVFAGVTEDVALLKFALGDAPPRRGERHDGDLGSEWIDQCA